MTTTPNEPCAYPNDWRNEHDHSACMDVPMTTTTSYGVKRIDHAGRERMVLAYPDDAGVPLAFETRAEAQEYVEDASMRALRRQSGASYEVVPLNTDLTKAAER